MKEYIASIVKEIVKRLSLFIVFVLFYTIVRGQYGLEFSSHNVETDQRTSMMIGTSDPLVVNDQVSLSFDLSFLAFQPDYFGYVFRLVTDNGVNIDLIYDRRPDEDKNFKLVVGDDFTPISFNIPKEQLYYDWTKIKLDLDATKRALLFTVGTKTYVYQLKKTLILPFKVLFGANTVKGFKTSDVPPMRIKDIRIHEGSTLKYHWPLDNITGSEAVDTEKKNKAKVVNPIWVKRQRSQWKMASSFVLPGEASVAFDKDKETLYFVGNKSMKVLRIGEGTGVLQTYTTGEQNLVSGSQSFFDPVGQRVLNISIDQQLVSAYDSTARTWTKQFVSPTPGTNYLLFSKCYLPADSSIYMLGGYGHFKYKATVFRYHIPSDTWHSLPFAEGAIFPHYLGAMGNYGNDVFFTGGYGSATGDQMLNPRVSNGFFKIDFQQRAVNAVYEFPNALSDMVWANNLIIDEEKDIFYGLTFSNSKFKTELQLVKGGLQTKQNQPIGNTIPYDFHDIRSYADLYYAPQSKSFVAVTLFYDEDAGETKVMVYTLLAPALSYIAVSEGLTGGFLAHFMVYMSIILLFVLLIWFFFFKQKRRDVPLAPVEPAVVADAVLVEEVAHMEEPMVVPTEATMPRQPVGIYLFGGDLKVIDREGAEITKKFSPLLKELLIVIMLYTIRWERGISSEKLTELFWADKSVSSARNNRAVNLTKLSNLLELLGDLKITKTSGYWSMEPIDSIYIDYYRFNRLISQKKALPEADIKELLKIIDKGGFLFEVDFAWLDVFKSEMAIQVLTTLSKFMENLDIKDNAKLIIEVCNKIFYFDEVNEDAMAFKSRSLIELGYHSSALQCYENFCQVYEKMYAEPYSKSFKDILSD